MAQTAPLRIPVHGSLVENAVVVVESRVHVVGFTRKVPVLVLIFHPHVVAFKGSRMGKRARTIVWAFRIQQQQREALIRACREVALPEQIGFVRLASHTRRKVLVPQMRRNSSDVAGSVPRVSGGANTGRGLACDLGVTRWRQAETLHDLMESSIVVLCLLDRATCMVVRAFELQPFSPLLGGHQTFLEQHRCGYRTELNLRRMRVSFCLGQHRRSLARQQNDGTDTQTVSHA